MTSLPRQLGYRMPAEWEPHEATWLSWPHNAESWPGIIEQIPPIWVEMTTALHKGEKVHINVTDENMELDVRTRLLEKNVDLGRVFFHRFPTNDSWARDHGPIFIVRESVGKKELAITDWEFNKWGGKYPPWDLDNVIPKQIGNLLKLPIFTPGIILEGGSIEVNGHGTLITTEQCLLNKNRNPHLKKAEIEQYLKDYLGVTHILWLGEGIVGDDTDGHIDDLTRFVNPTTVVTVVEENPTDENYALLQDNLKRLHSMKDQDGNPLTVIPLPMPGPVVYQGQRLPASYANFYIGNKVVLMPTYRHSNDEIALATLQKFFPDRHVIGIDGIHMIWGLGSFHCVTQQQPAI